MTSAPIAAAAPRGNNLAAWRVLLDGEDLTDRIAPRLLSLGLTEKRGGEADELRLELHDHDGRLAIPRKGAMLQVSLGWARGTDVRVGMVDKGSFKVDDVDHSGPPDKIAITARSADLTGDYRIRRDASYRDTTIGAIVADLAKRQGLEPKVAPELASIAVQVQGQSAKSDMALIRDLGRRHDAVATVKNGRLIFSPIGRGSTTSGQPLPAVRILRSEGDTHRYSAVDRGKYDGVSASWHDQDGAQRRTVNAGGSANAKRLKRTYASEADAKHAADAEWKRTKRGAAEFELDLALGRPDLQPEQAVTLQGWKPEIDGNAWLIDEVQHSIAGAGGFKTRLKLETAP
jgi:phage protein D